MCTIHETTSESNPFVTRMENNSYYPFSNKTEWDCFMLLKYHRLTKLQYEKVTEMLKDNNIPYLTYDQIQHCVKGLQTQQLSHSTDHVFYYNLESTIRYLLADPYIASQIHDGRNITDKEKGEPYATPGFKKLIEKSGSDILSVVLVLYFDEYRKYRTGSKNSGGFYLSLLNYSKSFLTGSTESISLLGKATGKKAFFDLMQCFKDDFNSIQGKTFQMYHAGMDQIVDVKIELGPWVWDSVQRWMSLCLEDKECSRCHHPKSEFANIPKNVLNPNEQNDYPNRNVEEAIQIYDNIENLNSNECKGMRPTWEQVLEMKDSQMDDKSRNNKIRELGQNKELRKVNNPLFYLKDHDVFEKSTVEYMHAEIQGLGRRHLRYILDEFNYTGIISDLQDLVSTTVNAAGQPLKFKVKDFENCSADDFLEFLAFSVHPIYQVLVKNSKLQGRSMVLRKKHVLCWSCHVSFVSHLLQDNLTIVGIEKARSSYIKFCKFFLELFKSKSCKFPNFHWIAHIFEDCLEWGSPRFFWALLFELKHKEFKQFNDSSNHKNVESRACEFEKLRRQIFINYPWYRTKCISEKWFPPLQSGQYIIFKDETNFKIGQVDSISPLGVSLRAVFKINNVHEATGLRTLAVEHISESVSLDSIYGRASIVKFDEHLVFNQHCLMMDFYKF